MSTACIIAACAANARQNNESKNSSKARRLKKDVKIYSKVIITMRLFFEACKIVRINKNSEMELISINNKVLAERRSFEAETSGEINKENLNKFISSEVRLSIEKRLIEEYKKLIEEEYNIKLKNSDIKYKTEFIYNIEW